MNESAQNIQDKEKIIALLKEARTTIFLAESSLKKGIDIEKSSLNKIVNSAINCLTAVQVNHL